MLSPSCKGSQKANSLPRNKNCSNTSLIFFTGDWSHIQFLPSTYQNFRFPKGNQVFSINHIVCTNTIGTMSHSYHLPNREKPSYQTSTKPNFAEFSKNYNLNIDKLIFFTPPLPKWYSCFSYHHYLNGTPFQALNESNFKCNWNAIKEIHILPAEPE